MIVNPCEGVAHACENWFLLEDFGLYCPIWGRTRLPLEVGGSGKQSPTGWQEGYSSLGFIVQKQLLGRD
jgi:hypothetical protein